MQADRGCGEWLDRFRLVCTARSRLSLERYPRWTKSFFTPVALRGSWSDFQIGIGVETRHFNWQGFLGSWLNGDHRQMTWRGYSAPRVSLTERRACCQYLGNCFRSIEFSLEPQLCRCPASLYCHGR